MGGGEVRIAAPLPDAAMKARWWIPPRRLRSGTNADAGMAFGRLRGAASCRSQGEVHEDALTDALVRFSNPRGDLSAARR
jgi:hypothetical protein